MHGERSLYRKIQIVLDYAKEGKHRDKESLGDFIHSQHPTNFIYYYRNRKTDKIEHKYSRTSIDEAIDLCVELELLRKDDLHPTKTGISAIDPRRFPTIIGKKVSELFSRMDFPVTSIQSSIRKILQASNPMVPTATEIWSQLNSNNQKEGQLDVLKFTRLITLLGQCKVLFMTQRRIFLPMTA